MVLPYAKILESTPKLSHIRVILSHSKVCFEDRIPSTIIVCLILENQLSQHSLLKYLSFFIIYKYDLYRVS